MGMLSSRRFGFRPSRKAAATSRLLSRVAI
jgi:hypothetical protein